jgi:diguanylate cyclase (GGDEF)-like protein
VEDASTRVPLMRAAELAARGMRRGETALLELLEANSDGEAGTELRAVLRIAGVAAGAHRLEDVVELVANEGRAALDAASFTIGRWERERGGLRTLINVGRLGPGQEPRPADELQPLSGFPLIRDLVLRGVPYRVAVDDPSADAAALETLTAFGKEAEIRVPIVFEGAIWGALWATADGDRRFDADDMRLLEAIAAQVATAIGRAELFDRVSRFAFEDPLTGLANRRGLDTRLRELLAIAERERSDLTLLICDVDGLKQVNDRLGHAAGDDLLRGVADILSITAAGYSDALLARLGGDEFCVVLPGRDLHAAAPFARAASRAVANQLGGEATLSWGATSLGGRLLPPSELLRAADAAQYAAKRLGGGRLKLNTHDEPPPITPGRGNERRALRSGDRPHSDDLIARVVETLDASRPRTTPDALELLAGELCRHLNAAAWTISVVRPGERDLQSVRGFESQLDPESGLRVDDRSDDDPYPLADYPQTARAIAEEGVFTVSVDSETDDPAEVEVLRELGYRTLVAAATAAPEGRYLLEVYGDEKSEGFASTAPVMRVLMAYCSQRAGY